MAGPIEPGHEAFAGSRRNIIPNLPDPNLVHLLGIDPSGVRHLAARPAGTRTEKPANPARLNRYQHCYERSGMGRIFQMQFLGEQRRS